MHCVFIKMNEASMLLETTSIQKLYAQLLKYQIGEG